MIKHLSTLSILHYVYGALVCVGGFIALSFMGVGAFVMDTVAAQDTAEGPPDWIGGYIASFGLGLFVLLLVWGILIMLSGYWISRKSNRTASIVVSALCLLSFPIGTALGVFTLIVLSSDDVREAYASAGPVVRTY